jgi:hypothetical protein
MDTESVAEGALLTNGVAHKLTSLKILKLSRSVRRTSHVLRLHRG